MKHARRNLVAMVALFVVIAGTLGAQEIRVSSSRGTAEILIPEAGWRQAVSGRLFPVGGSLATWTDGRVAFEGLAAEIEIGGLSVLDLIGAEERLVMRLVSGTVSVRAGDVEVVVETGLGTLRLVRATASYSDGTLTVEEGDVIVESARGGQRLVAAPDSARLGRIPVEPIFHRP
ncbi:MAG: hypothetical protein ACOC1U_10165 [Spirochaetota bacterium]